MESLEIKRKNLSIDIKDAIMREFYLFMKENPNWYIDTDWNTWGSKYRFGLQAERAKDAVLKVLDQIGFAEWRQTWV